MSNTYGDLFQSLRSGQPLAQEIDEQFPFYPLDTPGLPLPGANFIEHAVHLGDSPPVLSGGAKRTQSVVSWGGNLEYLLRRALYDAEFTLPVSGKAGKKVMRLVPGHLYGDDTSDMHGGPRPAKVMILGKQPGRDEVEARRNLVGTTSQILFDAFDELGVGDERFGFYVDNICKWGQVDEQSDSLPTAHKKDCELLLQQTLRLVQPDYLLCLGSEASKWLLGPAYGVNAMVGRTQMLTIPVNDRGEPVRYHTIQVMAATHPAAVHRTPELYPEFKAQIGVFISLINGAEVGRRETCIDHRNVYKHRELKAIVDEIIADPDPLRRIIAVDGEWEGESPNNPGAYLRTIQISTKHGEGICVVLRHQGGSPAFQPSIDHAKMELLRLLKKNGSYVPRVGGHFLRADLPWLIAEGLDVRDEYAPADLPVNCRLQGGWDTSLAYHAYNETASYRLTDMTVRLTQAPVYDTLLKRHVVEYCHRHGMKHEDLEGYGFLPDWILHPEKRDPEWGSNYAQYDPDVTRRIIMRCIEDGGLLDQDWHGNSSWEPYWRSHRASLGVLEMEMTGIKLDKDRVDCLTTLFFEAKQRLLDNFRQAINWPMFNPESSPQCVAFLFGDRYSQKRDKLTGERLTIRPPEAMTLNLTPIKSTGKRSKLWADIVARNETNAYTPSSDKEVLGIIGHAHPLAMQLRDLKFITQVLKGSLRPPRVEEDGVGWAQDEEGHLQYDRGLASAAQADGRVHTHISQNKETGRAASARPPLQNLSKRREGDYARILGSQRNYDMMAKIKREDPNAPEPRYGDYDRIYPQPLYRSPIRTIFCASPGHVLVEADYTGAELAVIAWLANDKNMIEHVRRNILPEKHPDHYDIHSHTAVDTFQLSCEPTKKGLKDAGLSPLRVAAKNVNFGIPYGRSAEAIARQCKEEGTDVSEADCQLMIEGYFRRYPGTARFLTACEQRSQNEQWLAGPFGRFRRFIRTRDRGVIGEQQRQSKNFPIQNAVADAAWTAIYNFWKFKQDNPQYGFKMCLQIHDALLFEVPIPELRDFLTNVLRPCMIDNVPIWPRHLDNTPMYVEAPYHFGIDHEIQLNWGEDITKEQAASLGIPQDLLD